MKAALSSRNEKKSRKLMVRSETVRALRALDNRDLARAAGGDEVPLFQLGLCGPDWRSTSRARIVRSVADGACFAAHSVGRDSGRKMEAPLADLW